MTIHLIGALAQLEREQVSERIRHVQAHKRSQGGYIGGTIATGLCTVQEGRNRKLVIEPTYGPAVAHCWDRVIKGASLKEIADYLDHAGVPTRSGKRWSKNSAGQVISNRSYVGLLVDEETFRRASAVLGCRFSPATAKRGVKPVGMAHQRPTDRVWRLQGLAFCAACGMALVGSQSKGRSGEWYPYLRCSGRQKRLGGCNAADVPATQAEDLVIMALVRSVRAGAVSEALASEQATRQITIAARAGLGGDPAEARWAPEANRRAARPGD